MKTSDRGRQASIEHRRRTRADGVVVETWSVRYWDNDGSRKRIRCDSAEHADYVRARIALEDSRPPADDAAVGSTPLGRFWPIWVSDASSRLQPETLAGLERLYEARVFPVFGELELRAIKPRHVAQWRAELLADNTGPETVRRTMNLLQAIFTVAVEWGEAETNPVKVVRKPKQGRRRVVEPLPPEEVEAIRAHMLSLGQLQSATMVSVLAYTGLRPGEMLALEVRHIRERTILVEQAAAHGRIKEQKTGRNYRTVDLLAPLREELLGWIGTLGTRRRDARLFPRDDGEVWRLDDWNNWRNRHFHGATKALGLGTPRPYDLRHSFASLMIREQRVSIVDLADQLGHAPTMTLNTYSHVMREHRGVPPIDAAEWIASARLAAGSSSGAEPPTLPDEPRRS